MALALPPDLDTGARLLLVFLMAHADDAGGGVYVGTETLCRLTGMARRTVFRHMATLASRGLVRADGWKAHPSGARTRQRRLDLDATGASSPVPAAAPPTAGPAPAAVVPTPRPKPADSAKIGTHHAAESANLGTVQCANPDTQTARANQERFQAILAWQPSDGLAPSEMLDLLWDQGGPALITDLTGKPASRARGLLDELVRLATRRHPERVLDALQGVSRDAPPMNDAERQLLAACKPDGWLSDAARMRRDWNLGSFGDEAYAAIYGARAA